jgi:hypothetical protein
MAEKHFNRLYDLDEDRLYSNFERIQNSNKNLTSIDIIAKFLFSRSIGNSIEEVSNVLTYYQKKLFKENFLLDFAFEWIRAQKIRLEYKKYFNLNGYKAYTIALDDVIFLFFLKYDEYLRNLFKNDTEEYEFSTLYQIFFNPEQSIPINLVSLLEKNKSELPTIIFEGEKVNTTIYTLREGLSDMIKGHFNEVIPSEVKVLEQKKQNLSEISTPEKNFDGTMIERLIKFYCFQNTKIDKKEFNLAINQFLSSYLQFNLFYNFHEFKDKLIDSLAEFIYSGLTEKYENYSMEILLLEINTIMNRFEKNMTRGRLKGKAWIEDLKSILLDFIVKFVDQL